MGDQSASAFAALRALDTDEPLRREMLAAGISSARVMTLYPPDFAALVPGIIQALTPDPLVIEKFPPLAKLVGRVVYDRSEFMTPKVRYPEISGSYVSAANAGEGGLHDLIEWAKPRIQGIASDRDWYSLKLGETTFFAYSFLAHYAELDLAHQEDAAELIEGVVHRLRLH
jgi:hypothetical protein